MASKSVTGESLTLEYETSSVPGRLFGPRLQSLGSNGRWRP